MKPPTLNSKKTLDDGMEIREQHYAKYLGKLDDRILHSADVNENPHIDIYQFPPTTQKPYWTLLTGGMSDARQCVPSDGWMSGRTELLMYAEEPRDWMFELLKRTAEMPFRNGSFVHWEHTYRPDINLAKKANLGSLLFLPPLFEDPHFNTLRINGDNVDLLWLLPIADHEYQYVIHRGSQLLIETILQAERPRIFSQS